MVWTSPKDLAAQIERLWQRGRLLSARFEGQDLFPLPLRLKRPRSQDLADRFDDVRTWIATLDQGSRARRGFGYDIVWDEINHRQLGRNRLPKAAVVPSMDDALALIKTQRQAVMFDDLARKTVARFPALRDWVVRKPLTIIEHAFDWEKILEVLAWFQRNPRSNLYLRQVDIAGIDTKFIEIRRGLLSELLEHVLGGPFGSKTFEQRFGLRARPALIRFRILDPKLLIHGLSDLTVPVEQLAMLDPPVRRVFITENEVNGLAFPQIAESLVLFRLGYALDLLASVSWLASREIYYWGDIDTHGFAMLGRLRAHFPYARALLMDRETLITHRSLWSRETTAHAGQVMGLNEEEQTLYDELKQNRLGEGVRLEQERIGFSWLQRALEAAIAQQSS